MGVIPRNLARRLARRGPRGDRALDLLAAAMGEGADPIPRGLNTARSQVEYLAAARGLAVAAVTLEEGWQEEETAYLLAETEGGIAALCPRPMGGYIAWGEGTRRFQRVGRKNAAAFQGKAWRVYPHLPEGYATPWAAAGYYLHRGCGPLLLWLAVLLLFLGGGGAVLGRLAEAVLRDALPGAVPWRAVLLPLAAALLWGGCTLWLTLETARRIQARAAEPTGASLGLRRGAGAGDLAAACGRAVKLRLLAAAVALTAAPVLAELGGLAPSAGLLLAFGLVLAGACGLLFRWAGRLPPGLQAALAALWLALGCVQVWAAGLGLAAGASYLTALLPAGGALLLLAGAAPALPAGRGGPPAAAPVPDPRPPLVGCDGSLAADEVRVGAVGPFSLDIAPGEKIGIYGPAGGGKTALLRLLSGTQAPQAGEVYCGEVDCAGVQTASLARWVRLVPRAGGDAVAEALREHPAILLADHVADRATAQAVLDAPGTAVLASARRELLAGCGRIFRLEGGVLREEGRGHG